MIRVLPFLETVTVEPPKEVQADRVAEGLNAVTKEGQLGVSAQAGKFSYDLSQLKLSTSGAVAGGKVTVTIGGISFSVLEADFKPVIWARIFSEIARPAASSPARLIL